MTFFYIASNVNGKLVRGKEEAENKFELVEKLRIKGFYCTSFKIVEKKKPRIYFQYKFNIKKLAFLCKQLSVMLTSGVNLARAIHILMKQEQDKEAKEALLNVYDELQRGKSFSEALKSKPGTFPPLIISMAEAGESSGNLDSIIMRVSDHYTKESKLNNTIAKSALYPAVLAVLMTVVIIILFTFIMPMFIKMFPNPDDIPALTKVMLSISDFLINKWYVIIILVSVLIIGLKAMFSLHDVRVRFDRLKCIIPKAGKLLRIIYMARFARTMASLYASGVGMLECIEKSAQTLGNAYITECFKLVLEDVKRGESLSAAIGKTNIFDNVFISSIYIGEESGRLDELLLKNADYYDEEADVAAGKLVSLIEPFLIIVMGIAVALVLASVFPALYGSFDVMAG